MQPSFCARDIWPWAYPKPRPPHPGFTKCAHLMLNPACLIVSNEKDLGHEQEPVMLERGANVGPAYAGALALMSTFRAYSGFWKCLGTRFNVKFWGQNS